jgi:hypothetical protein
MKELTLCFVSFSYLLISLPSALFSSAYCREVRFEKIYFGIALLFLPCYFKVLVSFSLVFFILDLDLSRSQNVSRWHTAVCLSLLIAFLLAHYGQHSPFGLFFIPFKLYVVIYLTYFILPLILVLFLMTLFYFFIHSFICFNFFSFLSCHLSYSAVYLDCCLI